ncbi:5-oxoprolinase subunit PxpB [Croceivirga thetidis]|uniref:5-oxoprolinase subunit PxpB n=1 Tax=Croceivirga thetidis TaxID=2721623 RepID=A0ABX1GTX4_9FLAO|nr:5-oxoprolinase subunit PxpB [Croceivirga thetidis]
MNSFPITIDAYGESAIIVKWPNEVSEEILDDILFFQEKLKGVLDDNWDLIPAYNSLTLVNPFTTISFQEIKPKLEEWYSTKGMLGQTERYLWKLPVCYDDEFALDFSSLEDQIGLSKEEIIKLHTSHSYTVYGIGFLPGFMYLGGLPPVLETKRRDTPRLHVDKGSVGLAGKQTGIYPQDSPGGWNIIGKCPVPMFNLKAKSPCFVSVGDKVQFFSIGKPEYEVYKIEAQVGILEPEKLPWNA